MSYRQAFHTSCRKGLTGHAGFQYNAASSGLDEEQLARLAAEHAGYRPPPAAPPEPDADQIARLPVTLRYLPVDGVGPAISRTAYVGREFRGAGGEPDSGRFGNYFSHIVVGDGRGDGGEAFGGLLPIELWQAPHWTTEEASEVELPALAALEPGPLDLDRVLAGLHQRGEAALAAGADAALRAVLGGPRLVIAEADPDLAAAWVAWACLALPPDRAGALTFSTFEGRPRMAESVQVCVTTPECDLDFPPYELGSSVVVLDPASSPAPGELSLYGRVLETLAGTGAEAVAAATREVGEGLGLEAAGAELAVAAGRTGLASAAEAGAVLAALRGRLGGTAAGVLAEMATALPPSDGPETFGEWSRLYAAARQSEDAEATALVDTALGRLLDSLDDAEGKLPDVDPDSPAVPSPGVLVRWIGLVTEAVGSERLAPALAAGVRLGLVGCNTALDKELAAPIAAGFADPAVQAAYEPLARAGNIRVVEGVALELAAAAGAGDGLDLLKRVAADPVARAAVQAKAEEAGDFESVAAWELLCTDSDPAHRAAAVAALAAEAETAGHERAIRGLYGSGGPASPAEHAELLDGWASAGREAPVRDYEAALGCLAEISFRDAKGAGRLFEMLRDGPLALRSDPELVAWSLRFEQPPKRQEFAAWAETASRLLQPGEATLSSSRQEDLRALTARLATQNVRDAGYAEGLEILLLGMGDEWPLELGDALAGGIAASVNPERRIAEAFGVWQAQKHWREVLLDVALPRATRDRAGKELEAAGEKLNERGQELWDQWLEQHPPRRGVSRAVRGVFRRGEER